MSATSGRVGSVIFGSGMNGRKYGVAVGIVSPSVSVQKSTSGFHFRFRADTCVSDVGQRQAVSAVSYSGRHGRKCGVAVEIASPSVFVQKVISTSGFVADILSFGCRPTGL